MKKPAQKGFTLIELMIAVVIVGLISVVVAKLFKGGMQGWIYSNANLNNQQRVRVARDLMVKSVRQAQAGSVEISSYVSGVAGDPANPPMSMITYTNATDALNIAFYQHKDKLYRGGWYWSGAPYASARVISVTARDPMIPSYVRRALFYYPNIKDDRNLTVTLHTYWPLRPSVANSSEVFLVGNINVRNP